MGLRSGLGKLTFLAWLTYEGIKAVVAPSDIYAQEKKDCSKANPTWEEKSRTEKIDYLHSTNNRIMPLVQTDSTGALEDIINGLEGGVSLFSPITINADLNYGDEFALDLTNFPTRKPYATQSFEGVSFDEAFNFIYNSIDKSYTSEKKVVINKCQATKNHEEIENALRLFETRDPKWAEYIKDGKLSAEEFKNLSRNVNAVKITSHDKNGKAIETGYAFINRRHDNTGKVKIVEKKVEVPVPYSVEVPVIEYRDTCITEPEEPCKVGVQNLTAGIGQTEYDKIMPQARIGIGNCDVELGAKVGYSGKDFTIFELKNCGYSRIYQDSELLLGADLNIRTIGNFWLGFGVNQRLNTVRSDQEVQTSTGNNSVMIYGKHQDPEKNIEANINHLGYTFSAIQKIGIIRVEGGVEIANKHTPKVYGGIGVNF